MPQGTRIGRTPRDYTTDAADGEVVLVLKMHGHNDKEIAGPADHSSDHSSDQRCGSGCSTCSWHLVSYRRRGASSPPVQRHQYRSCGGQLQRRLVVSYDRYHRSHRAGHRSAAETDAASPRAIGKTTLVAQLEDRLGPPVQRSVGAEPAGPPAAMPAGLTKGAIARVGDVVAYTDLEAEHDPDVARRASLAGLHKQRPLPDALRRQLENSYRVDFGPVRIVEDELADQRGVRGVAFGTQIHLAHGVDPEGAEGQHVIAHEAAHVVQQGAVKGEPARQGDVSAETPSLEEEAEVAARAALAGAPARLSFGRVQPAPMGFDSWEHKLVGDVVKRDYQIGQLKLSHGDLVMLMGDYFDARPDAPAHDHLFTLAGIPSHNPGQVPGSVDEVIAALDDCQRAPGSDPRFAPGGIWSKVRLSTAVKASMLDRFRRLALKNREHFAHPSGKGGDGPRHSAGGSYHAMHEAAVLQAYDAGRKAAPSEPALAYEALGQHFLTDAFSAGHLRTARLDIQEYWNARYPAFGDNLVWQIGTLVGIQLVAQQDKLQAVALGAGADLPALILKSVSRVKAQLGDAGPPAFGDLISSMVHDVDNVKGLQVTNDLGWQWTAYGDDHMLDGKPSAHAGGRSHVQIMKLAVALGVKDVDHAFELGKRDASTPRAPEAVLADVRARTLAPAEVGDKYAPEQLLPRVVAGSGGLQEWKAANFEDLLARPVRSDMPQLTFEAAFKQSASSGGTMYLKFEQVAKDQDDDVYIDPMDIASNFSPVDLPSVDAVKLKTGLHPKGAFLAVLKQLADDPIGMFRSILNRTSPVDAVKSVGKSARTR
jgi:hypothetical protein